MNENEIDPDARELDRKDRKMVFERLNDLRQTIKELVTSTVMYTSDDDSLCIIRKRIESAVDGIMDAVKRDEIQKEDF
jgi:hypothetical protein